MKQPRKDALREQLALAADEIIRLKTELDRRQGFFPSRVVSPSALEWQREQNRLMTNVLRPMSAAATTPPRAPWWRRLLTWGRA